MPYRRCVNFLHLPKLKYSFAKFWWGAQYNFNRSAVNLSRKYFLFVWEAPGAFNQQPATHGHRSRERGLWATAVGRVRCHQHRFHRFHRLALAGAAMRALGRRVGCRPAVKHHDAAAVSTGLELSRWRKCRIIDMTATSNKHPLSAKQHTKLL